jgi:hypothetical protein
MGTKCIVDGHDRRVEVGGSHRLSELAIGDINVHVLNAVLQGTLLSPWLDNSRAVKLISGFLVLYFRSHKCQFHYSRVAHISVD